MQKGKHLAAGAGPMTVESGWRKDALRGGVTFQRPSPPRGKWSSFKPFQSLILLELSLNGRELPRGLCSDSITTVAPTLTLREAFFPATWLLFGETLGDIQLLSFAMTVEVLLKQVTRFWKPISLLEVEAVPGPNISEETRLFKRASGRGTQDGLSSEEASLS